MERSSRTAFPSLLIHLVTVSNNIGHSTSTPSGPTPSLRTATRLSLVWTVPVLRRQPTQPPATTLTTWQSSSKTSKLEITRNLDMEAFQALEKLSKTHSTSTTLKIPLLVLSLTTIWAWSQTSLPTHGSTIKPPVSQETLVSLPMANSC